ncbi:MAG: xanthine dehydrogenase family protein subunit M, partial [Nostocoides sp.]
GDTPHLDTTLDPDELVTAVRIPGLAMAQRSRYRKVRDRASYAFALISVAAALDLDGDTVRGVRVALGGVAHKPWRATVLEEHLTGRPASDAALDAAAEAELAAARPGPDTAFKVGLAVRTISAVLRQLRDQGGAA